MPAPVGNQNAAKGKRWRDAIDRALESESRARGIQILDEIALTVVRAAMEGPSGEKSDPWLDAVRELGDRLDGRPGQSVTVSGDPEQPLQSNVTVEFVRAGADSGSA